MADKTGVITTNERLYRLLDGTARVFETWLNQGGIYTTDGAFKPLDAPQMSVILKFLNDNNIKATVTKTDTINNLVQAGLAAFNKISAEIGNDTATLTIDAEYDPNLVIEETLVQAQVSQLLKQTEKVKGDSDE